VLVLDVLAVFFPPMNLFLPPPPPPILLFGKVLNDFFSNFFFLSSFIHSRDSNSSQPSNSNLWPSICKDLNSFTQDSRLLEHSHFDTSSTPQPCMSSSE
jgi:hypothetical protein